MQPEVARAIVSPQGKIVKDVQPKMVGTLPVDKPTIDFLHEALRAVVTSGTAAGSFAGLGVEVSGKTGTGQVFGKNLNGTKKDDTSWFASFAPSKNPQYVVVMMVSQGGFGATASGIGVRKIYEHIFGTNGQTAIFPNGASTKIPRIDANRGAGL